MIRTYPKDAGPTALHPVFTTTKPMPSDLIIPPPHRYRGMDIMLVFLIRKKKLSPATVMCTARRSGFFFAVTSNRTLNYLQLPRQKVPKFLPTLLSRQEIAVLLDHCHNFKHKDLFTLLPLLRDYWRANRPTNPEGWLFLGAYAVTHITPDAIHSLHLARIRHYRLPSLRNRKSKLSLCRKLTLFRFRARNSSFAMIVPITTHMCSRYFESNGL